MGKGKRALLFFYHWILPIAVILTTAVCGYLLFVKGWRPPVGVFVAAIAVGAALITIWQPVGRTEKALWLLALVFMGVFEINNLYKDRDVHDAEERETRAEQNNRFDSISHNLQESMKASKDSFDTTLGKMSTLSELSKQNVDSVTGGNGFAYGEILSPLVDKDGAVLMAVVKGEHSIRNVEFTVFEAGYPTINFNDEKQADDFVAGRAAPSQTTINLGDLAPHIGHRFRVIHPPLKAGEGTVAINVLALNGFVQEKMEVRRIPSGWDSRVVVTSGLKSLFKRGWIHPTVPTLFQ